MQKLGIIGTNWITKQFVDASHSSGSFELTHVYSRTEEKAKKFAADVNKPDAAVSVDLDAFFESSDFDTVYIASPNSLHFKQAKSALEHGKNVIVEKPSFSNPREFEEIEELLKNSGLFLFEAARHIHENSFKKVNEYIGEHRESLTGASLSYMKYSSRYDQVLAGEEPNIFSLKFSAGALYDLGVYTIYDAIVWFGRPESVRYEPEIIKTGIDGSGVVTLKYNEFDVNILFGKTKNSFMSSEIYFGKDTLQLDNAGTIRDITEISNDEKKKIQFTANTNPMVDEAKTFSSIIEKQNIEEYKRLFEYAKIVNETLYKLREDAGIKFSAD
ncbi:Gfo/Idh/MocA family protein [Companilactobacillus sp. DQM5]|uniref:Gfo/Idh/MocA family protein n=1 Tax=Companilactobacillus sp. DQM5 TaxID=3463359 RepID=UPI004058E05F